MSEKELRRSLRDSHHMVLGGLLTCCGLVVTTGWWHEDTQDYITALIPVLLWMGALSIWYAVVSARRYHLLLKR